MQDSGNPEYAELLVIILYSLMELLLLSVKCVTSFAVNSVAPAVVAMETSSVSEPAGISVASSSSLVTSAAGPAKTWHRHPGLCCFFIIIGAQDDGSGLIFSVFGGSDPCLSDTKITGSGSELDFTPGSLTLLDILEIYEVS